MKFCSNSDYNVSSQILTLFMKLVVKYTQLRCQLFILPVIFLSQCLMAL